MIHGARGEDDCVDLAPREKLGVAAVSDSEPPPDFLSAPLPRRCDRHQFGSGKPLSVLGMESAHPAEAGDAEPKRGRRT
jgi:hypothetical protein